MYYIGDLIPFKLSFFDIMAQQRVWRRFGTGSKPPLQRYHWSDILRKVTMHSLKCCVPILTCITTILLSKQCHE